MNGGLAYEREYEHQPSDEWMLCPWHDDPEEKQHTKGIYAKKCVCPNCFYHRYTGDSVFGKLKRWLVDTGYLSQKCKTCRKYNDCTAEEGDCGWTGRVRSIELTNTVEDTDE